MEVLRNDLGGDDEKVSDIKFDGVSIGSCNPDGGDYDCTFYNCQSALTETTYTPASSTINVELVYTGHSHDCDCDVSSWECSEENTVAGRAAMTAVARITLTPQQPVLCRTASAPDSEGNAITPQQGADSGSTLYEYNLGNIIHPLGCTSLGSWCYNYALTVHYYEISWGDKKCMTIDLDSTRRDEEEDTITGPCHGTCMCTPF